MKKVSLLVLFAFVLGSLSYGQLGIASVTYNMVTLKQTRTLTIIVVLNFRIALDC